MFNLTQFIKTSVTGQQTLMFKLGIMKHSRLLVFLIAFSFLSCENLGGEMVESVICEVNPRFSVEHLFSLSDFGIDTYGSSSQGMDIYNDKFMFQAGLPGGIIHVLDLENISCIGSVAFNAPNNEPSHLNNINCGEKFNNTDLFPLLYVSQTSDSHFCYVIRILDDVSSYEVIQVVSYKGNKHHVGSNFDWFIDLKRHYICTYGKRNGMLEEREIVLFPIPSIYEKEIVFSDDDVVDSFVLQKMSIYQGSRIIDGQLYAPVGYGNDEYPGELKIISLDDKVIMEAIMLNCGEPESIGQYMDGAIICGGGRDPEYYFIQL